MNFIIGFLSKWYNIFKGARFSIFCIYYVIISFLFFEIFWKINIDNYTIGYLLLFVISVICVAGISIDMLAWMFKKLDNFGNIAGWYDFKALEQARLNPPRNDVQSAKLEKSMLESLPFELKKFALEFGAKLSINVLLLVLSFAIIFSCVNRLSVNPPAFMDIGPEASAWYCVFYSLDVITTLGGAAPTPNVDNVWIWVATGMEIVMLIVGSLVILTLVTASVYEVFNLKTTYYSAFLRSIQVDGKKNSS